MFLNYIGKTTYAGGELYDFTMLKYGDFENIDSLAYGVYKNEVEKLKYRIFTIEKFVKNDEMEEWKILDTLNIKNFINKDFVLKEVIIGKKVKIIALFKNIKLKEWVFNKKKFSLKLIAKSDSVKLNTKNLEGLWSLNCHGNTIFSFYNDIGYMSLYDENQIYINLN